MRHARSIMLCYMLPLLAACEALDPPLLNPRQVENSKRPENAALSGV